MIRENQIGLRRRLIDKRAEGNNKWNALEGSAETRSLWQFENRIAPIHKEHIHLPGVHAPDQVLYSIKGTGRRSGRQCLNRG
ncbi:MAG: hypothetical protein PHD58_05995, partial [Anaerolineales bacterium]|nr:hypothetical protein [Anaerolineales bacterium]